MRAGSVGKFYSQCAVLELQTVSTLDELKITYRRLIQRWHPDRHHGDAVKYEIALEGAKAINAAYEYLSEVLEAGLVPPKARMADATSTSSWRSAADAYRTRRTYQQQPYRAGFPDQSVLEVFVKSSNIVSIGYNSAMSAHLGSGL